jgi:hypothetical protein
MKNNSFITGYALAFSICFLSNLCFCQELRYDDGLFIEKMITKDTSIHRYSVDNIVCKPDYIFLFDYYFTNKNGEKQNIAGERNSDFENQKYETTEINSQSLITIENIKMTVTDNLKLFLRMDSTYAQTVIKYEYCDLNGDIITSEETGLIENTKNVWLHPPRNFYFKVLEINPFPFIRIDTVKNWSWPFQVGGFWSDSKWKEWQGRLDIETTYEKQEDEILETKFGKLQCRVVVATASSKIGKSFLKSYFNSVFGFVKLEYTNIDSTKIFMELIHVSHI